jgi:hypothetical protein
MHLKIMPENPKPETFLRYAPKKEQARHVKYTDGTIFILVIDPDRDLRPRSNRRWRMEKSSPEFNDENKHMQSLTLQMTFHYAILRRKFSFVTCMSTVEPRFTNLIRSWRSFVNRNVRNLKLFFP